MQAFQEGQRVSYRESTPEDQGTVTKVLAETVTIYRYVVEWDDENPKSDEYNEDQLSPVEQTVNACTVTDKDIEILDLGASLELAIDLIEGLADQQAMGDDWYVEGLERLKKRLTEARESATL